MVPNTLDPTSPTCTRYKSQTEDLFYFFFFFSLSKLLHRCQGGTALCPSQRSRLFRRRSSPRDFYAERSRAWKNYERTLETEVEAGAESRGGNGGRKEKTPVWEERCKSTRVERVREGIWKGGDNLHYSKSLKYSDVQFPLQALFSFAGRQPLAMHKCICDAHTRKMGQV